MEILITPLAATILWGILLALFVFIEIATLNLVTIWFAAGSLAALLSSLFIDNLMYQILIFLVVSLLALIATKPLVKRARSHKPAARVELDRNLGRTAQALEELKPGVIGRVRLDGVDWNAQTTAPLLPGSACVVTAIHGNTLTVSPADQTDAV